MPAITLTIPGVSVGTYRGYDLYVAEYRDLKLAWAWPNGTDPGEVVEFVRPTIQDLISVIDECKEPF